MKQQTNSSGVELIAIERQRQIIVEGWDKEHDEDHEDGELAIAASLYAMPHEKRKYRHGHTIGDCVPKKWPWERQWWKPAKIVDSTGKPAIKDRVRELTKAGGLIAAEIDRLLNLKTNNNENK